MKPTPATMADKDDGNKSNKKESREGNSENTRDIAKDTSIAWTTNPFMNFLQYLRSQRPRTNNVTELAREAGRLWKAMTPEEKKPYIEAARRAVGKQRKRRRYRRRKRADRNSPSSDNSTPRRNRRRRRYRRKHTSCGRWKGRESPGRAHHRVCYRRITSRCEKCGHIRKSIDRPIVVYYEKKFKSK